MPDTIAALATPAGTAALAVLRLSGVDTPRLCREALGTLPSPRMLTFGRYREKAGAILDDVMFVRFEAPRSYTGEDALEITCHGNPLIAQKILEDLVARGCRMAGPGEFTQRAFLNRKLDLSQAEAVMDVIHARSERALEVANRQLRGALSREMEWLIDRILAVLARVEAYIDFPEEDLPPEDKQFLHNGIADLLARTRRLAATGRYGSILRDGMKTVLIGPPNAGKSSLLNQLVGRERALVSPEPGTTRDFIEERIAVGPHSLRLIDTAGLNKAPSPLEAKGMEKTMERLVEADLVLLVVDGSDEGDSLSPALLEALPADRTILVVNKIDLGPATKRPCWGAFQDQFSVSALTGSGVETLIAAIVRRADQMQSVAGEDVIAISARHSGALAGAVAALEVAMAALENGGELELLASDLREALVAYGEISGRVDNERMLDELFATFCIGK